MSFAVCLEAITVTDRDKRLLNEVSLQVERNEFLGILGPNGAGKSTLLKTLNGLRRIASGRITVLDQDLLKCRGLSLARLRCRIGYVPQGLRVDSLLPITVEEAILLGRIAHCGPFRPFRAEDRRRVREMMDELELFRLAGQPFGQISGGEQQKVLIARALVQGPEILLLDEPTANLDLKWQWEIIKLIEEIYWRRKLTVVMVSHEIHHIPALCQRVALIEGGRMTYVGDKKSAFSGERMSALYQFPLEASEEKGRFHLHPRPGQKGQAGQ